MPTDPTTPRLPEKLVVAYDAVCGHIRDAAPPYESLARFDGQLDGAMKALVSRYNAHPAYARAAEALRELVEAEDSANKHERKFALSADEEDRIASIGAKRRRLCAWASARDALAALKEVG